LLRFKSNKTSESFDMTPDRKDGQSYGSWRFEEMSAISLPWYISMFHVHKQQGGTKNLYRAEARCW
jgi:hypothetical protein